MMQLLNAEILFGNLVSFLAVESLFFNNFFKT